MDHRTNVLNLLNNMDITPIVSVTKELNTSHRFTATTRHGELDGSSLLRVAHFGPVTIRSNPYVIPTKQVYIVGHVEDGVYVWWFYASSLRTLHRTLKQQQKVGVWIRSRRLVSSLDMGESDVTYGLLCCIYKFWAPFTDSEYRHPYAKDGYIRRSSLRLPSNFLSAAALFLGDPSIPMSDCSMINSYIESLGDETQIERPCTCTD